MNGDLTEAELDRQLAQCRLADASDGLRDRVLASAAVEWPMEPSTELRAQVLSAAEVEWDRPAEKAEEISWRVPFLYLAISAAAAVALVFVATMANNRALAQWQSPNAPVGTLPQAVEPSRDQIMAAPALAALRNTTPPKDFLRQLRRSRAMLNHPEGERI